MKFFLKLGLILLAFCVVATGILAYVNSITKPKIDDLKRKEAELARGELIPNAVFEPVTIKTGQDSLVYFIALDNATKELKGYTFTAAKIGYSSTVKTMAAVDADFKLINIKVIDQAETPGLGANCTKPEFNAKFKGLTLDELKVDKDGGKVEAMTGATITTRAVTNSLKEQISIVKKDVEAKLATPEPVEDKR